MMDGISVSLEGTNAIFSNLDQLSIGMDHKVNVIIAQAAHQTFDDSQNACPVDTGLLKASASWETNERFKASVTYGTDHCWYVELGTYKMAAQPFLYPAFLDNVAWAQLKLNGLLGG